MNRSMSGGMFVLNCPECEAELAITDAGTRMCPNCRSTYLARFGHVIRIGMPGAVPSDQPSPVTGVHTTDSMGPVDPLPR